MFISLLEKEIEDYDKDTLLKEKVIALKSVFDGLIVHGINSEASRTLFTKVSQDFLRVKNRFLRQVAIEGVCKMLFVKKIW